MLDILLADDHDVVRRGLRGVLEARADWRVCGEASNGREAVELALRLRPDVAVLDLSMPGLSGLELQQAVAARGSELPIIFLTGRGDISASVQAMKHGAMDFLQKPIDDEVLLAAVAQAPARAAVLHAENGEQRRIAEIVGGLRTERSSGCRPSSVSSSAQARSPPASIGS